MVLLSGKRKNKDSVQQIVTNFIDPYLDNQHLELKGNMICTNTNDILCNKLVQLLDRVPIQPHTSGDLGYQFKTMIKLKPEYELYHLLYKTKIYDNHKLDFLRECLSKKMSFSKIKYVCNLYV
jgi:hypothetical protein